ncbi:MAG: hypothetical protein IPK63_04035 [Candidatus Competibacteraceae bacterium]|nr:hypothetical protein [Candidatus Competibacteraceae bacterium]
MAFEVTGRWSAKRGLQAVQLTERLGITAMRIELRIIVDLNAYVIVASGHADS